MRNIKLSPFNCFHFSFQLHTQSLVHSQVWTISGPAVCQQGVLRASQTQPHRAWNPSQRRLSSNYANEKSIFIVSSMYANDTKFWWTESVLPFGRWSLSVHISQALCKVECRSNLKGPYPWSRKRDRNKTKRCSTGKVNRWDGEEQCLGQGVSIVLFCFLIQSSKGDYRTQK